MVRWREDTGVSMHKYIKNKHVYWVNLPMKTNQNVKHNKDKTKAVPVVSNMLATFLS